MSKSIKLTLALLASTAAFTPALAVQHYKIIDLGVIAGGSSSAARAISSNGMIGGESNLSVDVAANAPTQFNPTATQLPDLAGENDTYIRGINNAGVAAAVVTTPGGNDRAALISSGGAIQLAGLAGYDAAGAFDVNNAGVAVGYVLSSGASGAAGANPIVGNVVGTQKAVMWVDGVATLLDSPAGAVNTMAYAINDDGTIAGMYRTSTGVIRGVTWTGGVATAVELPVGENSTRTRAISEAGWVAGQTTGALGVFGTVWTPTGTYLLPQLVVGALVQDSARGINSAGTVVGFSNAFDENGDPLSAAAMLWDYAGGSYTAYDLSTLVDNLGTWQLGVGAPQAINDKGDIVGFGAIAPGGAQHAFLLTAVPEPASWALMVAGFGMMGGALRRRRAVAA